MKKGLWLMILSGLLLKAQAQGTLQQYYYMGQGRPVAIVPIASYQASGKLYFESRYNYEALKAFSFYAGQTFKKEGRLSYSVTPMAGMVLGSLSGGSIAANVEFEYRKFAFSSQPQYTFSIRDNAQTFGYSWSDLSYQLSDWLAAGLSVQNTVQMKQKSSAEKGLFAQVAYKNWIFPIYVFSPGSTDMNFVAGIRFELPFGKRKPGNMPDEDIFISDQLSLIEPVPGIAPVPAPQYKAIIASSDPSKETKYFVLTGAYRTREEAAVAQSKLPVNGDTHPVLYVSGNEYKVRVAGFEKYVQAQAYLAQLPYNDLKYTCTILPYQAKGVIVEQSKI